MSILEGFPTPVRAFPSVEDKNESTGISALEERIGARFDAIERRLDAAERLASERHSWTLEAIARLAALSDLKERISRIEARQPAS